MLVESGLLKHGDQTGATKKIQFALSRATRATDVKGGYGDGDIIGVIFIENPLAEISVVQTLSRRVNHALHGALGARAGKVGLSFHVSPAIQKMTKAGCLRTPRAVVSGNGVC